MAQMFQSFFEVFLVFEKVPCKMEALSQLGGNIAAAAAGNNADTTLETTLMQLPPLEPPVQLQPAQLAIGPEQHKRSLEDGDDVGKRKSRRVQVKNKCEHDRWKDGRCTDCLCKHKVRRGDCKEGCSESSRKFCIHDRRKHGCKECFPASFCEHGKKKRRCVRRQTLAPRPLSWRLNPLSLATLPARYTHVSAGLLPPGAASAATPSTLTSVRTTAGRGSVKSAAAHRYARCVGVRNHVHVVDQLSALALAGVSDPTGGTCAAQPPKIPVQGLLHVPALPRQVALRRMYRGRNEKRRP